MKTSQSFLLVAIALSTSFAHGGDLASMVFESSQHVSGGKIYSYDLYYIFLGDNGSLDQGDMLQINTIPGEPGKYNISKARFTSDSRSGELTVYFQAQQGQRIGSIEVATLKDLPNGKTLYQITEHSDESQIGVKEKVQFVDFQRLPVWVRNAMQPHLVAKLPPEQRVAYHQMEAAQTRATIRILEGMTKIFD